MQNNNQIRIAHAARQWWRQTSLDWFNLRSSLHEDSSVLGAILLLLRLHFYLWNVDRKILGEMDPPLGSYAYWC